MPTEKQKAVVIAIAENHGNMGKAMRAVGYKPITSDSPKKNLTGTVGFKIASLPMIEQLDQRRQEAINALSNAKAKGAKYRDLVDAVDKLTKNIQLLGGGATESVEYSWDTTSWDNKKIK